MDTNPGTSINMQKKDFRAKALRARNELTPENRREKSRLIIERLYGMPALKYFRSWFVYVSFKTEVETHGLIHRLLSAGKHVSVPIIDSAANTMTASHITDFEHDLAPGSMGILEPKPGCLEPVAGGGIDIVIAPGAAFAPDGYRVGYGGGYYDRFLSACAAPAVGLAYDVQIFDRVPHDAAHDIPLACIITESRLIDCRGMRPELIPA